MITSLIKGVKSNVYGEKQFLIGLLITDKLLEDFNLSISDKNSLLEPIAKSCVEKALITTDTKIVSKIGNIYRAEKSIIHNSLSSLTCLVDYDLGEAIEPIKQRSVENRQFIEIIQGKISADEIKKILPSLIHMSLNRLFSSNQILQETFTYQILSSYYGTCLKRKNKEAESSLN